jgi:hypothetical protein
VLTHEDLIKIVSEEIDERYITMSESGDDYDTTDEVKHLNVLLNLLKNKQPLSYSDYSWLCDLVETSVQLSVEI